MASARVTDVSDAELLYIVADLADRDGWVEAHAVAQRLWPTANGQSPQMARCVSSRFSWMRRYGLLERRGKGAGDSAWRLTERGDEFRQARLGGAVSRRLDEMDTAELLPLAGWLTSRYRAVDPLAATVLRRAWTSGTAPR